MNNPIRNIKNFIEWQAFGVCTAIGEKIGVSTGRIRLWFIYVSFLTLGSPIIVYMVLAFWIQMKEHIFMRRRNPVRWL
jgi:phage shock protein PspC (stress-responsive transcriptional regulator)